MAVSKAHIDDLVSLASNAKGSSAQLTNKPNAGMVHDFISMLAKYAQPAVDAVGGAVNDVSQGLKENNAAWADVPRVLTGYATGHGDEIAKEKPQELSPSAQRGMDLMGGAVMGGNAEMGAIPGNIGYIGKQALGKGEDIVQDIAKTTEIAKSQPGGLQAGFIKPNEFITGSEAPPVNQVILDAKGNPIHTPPQPTEFGSYVPDARGNLMPNKNPQPRLDSPVSPEYASVEGNPSATMMPPKEPIAPVTKPVIPPQPELNAAQQKAFAKSGLDKYQLPAKYGDKRATLESIDKSVMANVIGGNSPEEILQNIPKAEQKVWGEVTRKAATIPAVDVNQGVIAHIDRNLQELVKQGIITDTEAAQRLATEKTSIFSKTSDPLNPTSISGKNLVELQTGANAAAPKTIPQGMTRPEPYMNKAIAQGYRDAIGDMSPDIRYSYNQYSSIKRIGEMSNDFRNTAGKPPTFIDRLRQNPALTIGAAALAVPEAIAGVKAGLPAIGNAVGTGLGLASAGVNGLEDFFTHENKGYAQDKGKEMSTHNAPIIPQDAQGRYVLPPSPNVTPLTPGTPEYTRANNALPGASRQFMANSPQYMNTANAVNDDIKAGMPLNLMSKFKSAQDVQAYLSDPSNPYAKQLANIGSMNSKFMSAYQLINGTKPDDSQMISPGDSQEQFQEKYNQMIKFIYDNYSQYQVPYLQTTSAPMAAPQGGGTVPYQQPQQNDDWSGMKQGAIPNVQGLPPIGAIPAQ